MFSKSHLIVQFYNLFLNMPPINMFNFENKLSVEHAPPRVNELTTVEIIAFKLKLNVL